jgi:hypothetical protein
MHMLTMCILQAGNCAAAVQLLCLSCSTFCQSIDSVCSTALAVPLSGVNDACWTYVGVLAKYRK